MRFDQGRKPRFFAHRGGALEAPENTLEAFRNGIAAGADYLELDVHASADGEIVVMHDPTLERTTNGSGEVRRHTLAELQALDAGYTFLDEEGRASFRGQGVRIPTLAEVCREFPDTAINMEIKQAEPNIIRAVLDVLAANDATARSLVAAEKASLMEPIRREVAGKDFFLGFATEDIIAFLQVIEAGEVDSYEPVGFALQIPAEFLGSPLVTPELVEAAHGRGIEVHVWTVDVEAEMDRLLDLGVDGLMTDRPTLLGEVLRRRSEKA
ncbi:MAG: glycerophosphodiester phosphodiesterase [Deltaproteobacteria bacterium]